VVAILAVLKAGGAYLPVNPDLPPARIGFMARDADADVVTVDALARLQLEANRLGCRMRLRDASAELLELVAFMGLADVLPVER